ncbi:ABC transporter ATP-binding protein [Helicobacter sp. 11S02629-2]|uniref:cell division ATP-binding protein FtsE n=1 Tax=Helicobacter sp. 11S02629-2 TaxID=1476195 RepID=UPI000BA6C817|nr:ABC transporter ATP-binding protein [Helicobacter sp. 11S02629-2]PAF45651.1 ABC transporter ATP-binding protein [Helicobacter sp. 11S02629-2]
MNVLIKADKLNLGYKKDELIIKNANFEIHQKDFVFITGPSGSGKSTLLRSFYGALKVQKGSLQVNGFNMKRLSSRKLASLRRAIGVVFQDYKLINEWNVEKNIALPMIINGFSKNETKQTVEMLLSHINLLHKANKYPPELSGGEQQRIALARALSHRPKLILCDEPTGNLDDYSSDMIWGLLKSSNEQLGITIVVVTHRLPTHLNIRHRKIEIIEGEVNERT